MIRSQKLTFALSTAGLLLLLVFVSDWSGQLSNYLNLVTGEVAGYIGIESCSGGWYITGYFTPVEADYNGALQTVSVENQASGAVISRDLKSDFLSDVQIEGWGRTDAGDYVGYWDGQYWGPSSEPLDSNNNPLETEVVAVDPSIIPHGKNITIPTLPSPWNDTVFRASDVGPAIVGKHIDVYAGEGAGAEQETFRITQNNATVCVVVVVDDTPPSPVPFVNDGIGSDADTTQSASQLSASWSNATDSESGVVKYLYAIGTSRGGTNVVGWTDAGSVLSITRTGLALSVGSTYYFSVKAVNGFGLESAVVSSDGISVTSPPQVQQISGLFAAPQNNYITFERDVPNSVTGYGSAFDMSQIELNWSYTYNQAPKNTYDAFKQDMAVIRPYFTDLKTMFCNTYTDSNGNCPAINNGAWNVANYVKRYNSEFGTHIRLHARFEINDLNVNLMNPSVRRNIVSQCWALTHPPIGKDPFHGCLLDVEPASSAGYGLLVTEMSQNLSGTNIPVGVDAFDINDTNWHGYNWNRTYAKSVIKDADYVATMFYDTNGGFLSITNPDHYINWYKAQIRLWDSITAPGQQMIHSCAQYPDSNNHKGRIESIENCMKAMEFSWSSATGRYNQSGLQLFADVKRRNDYVYNLFHQRMAVNSTDHLIVKANVTGATTVLVSVGSGSNWVVRNASMVFSSLSRLWEFDASSASFPSSQIQQGYYNVQIVSANQTTFNTTNFPSQLFVYSSGSGAPQANDPPSVVSVSNTPTAPSTQQTVSFTATATDDTGLKSIQIYVDGSPMGSSCSVSGTGPSSCTRTGGPFSAGAHNFHAIATDVNNQNSAMSPISFTVQSVTNNPPTTVSVSHSPSSPTSTQSLTFTAAASDDIGLQSIQIFVDGSSVGSCSVSGTSASCSKSAGPYAAGSSHTYSAVATDTIGQTSSPKSSSFTVQGGVVNSPPAVSASHSPSSPTSSQTVTITATATDDVGISKVEIFVDGSATPSKTCASATCSYTAGPFAGGSSHTYSAKATDTGGLTATSFTGSIIVQSVTVPVGISITSPANNSQVPAGSVLVSGSASGTSISAVEVALDGDSATYKLATPRAPSDWSTWSINYDVPAGSHFLLARVTGASGQATSSLVLTGTTASNGTVAQGGNGKGHGPKAKLKFDEATGLVAYDSSGNGNHGWLAGPTWQQNCKCVKFNGGTDRVQVADSSDLDLANNLTLSVLLTRDVILDDENYIISKQDWGTQTGYSLFFNKNILYFRILGEGGNTLLPVYLPNTGTMHIVATYDGSTMKVYLNTTEISSKAASMDVYPNDVNLTIGLEKFTWGTGFEGLIHDVSIYDYAMDQSEVDGLFFNLTGSEFVDTGQLDTIVTINKEIRLIDMSVGSNTVPLTNYINHRVLDITFDTTVPASNVSVTVENLTSRPASLPELGEDIYRYLEISKSGISDSEIASAKIRFTVEKSWLQAQNINPNKVTLNRFNSGVWNKLPTTIVADDVTSYTFEAVTPGFSVFAIAGEEEPASGGNQANDTATNDTSVSQPPAQTAPSTSGGGGGGGSGTSSAASAPSTVPEVKTVDAGTNGVIIVMSDPESHGVTDITIEPNKQIDDASVSVRYVDNKPDEVDKEPGTFVYRYLEITKSGISDEDLKRVNIKFRVDRQWILDRNVDPDSVSLNRWRGTYWEKMPTKSLSRDDDFYIFEAYTSGFSIFAISGERTASPFSVFSTETEVADENYGRSSSGFGNSLNTGNISLAIIAAVIIAIAIMVMFMLRKNFKQVFFRGSGSSTVTSPGTYLSGASPTFQQPADPKPDVSNFAQSPNPSVPSVTDVPKFDYASRSEFSSSSSTLVDETARYLYGKGKRDDESENGA